MVSICFGQNVIGHCYNYGLGVVQDCAQDVRSLRLAAAHGACRISVRPGQVALTIVMVLQSTQQKPLQRDSTSLPRNWGLQWLNLILVPRWQMVEV